MQSLDKFQILDEWYDHSKTPFGDSKTLSTAFYLRSIRPLRNRIEVNTYNVTLQISIQNRFGKSMSMDPLDISLDPAKQFNVLLRTHHDTLLEEVSLAHVILTWKSH